MALAKKKSRLIHVDGDDYRWAVSPDDGFMVLVVERAQGPGSRLLVYTGYDELLLPKPGGAGFLRSSQIEITPGFVRRWVDYALAHGWTPAIPGREFRLRRTGKELP
jgi:hypothetical protein